MFLLGFLLSVLNGSGLPPESADVLHVRGLAQSPAALSLLSCTRASWAACGVMLLAHAVNKVSGWERGGGALVTAGKSFHLLLGLSGAAAMLAQAGPRQR